MLVDASNVRRSAWPNMTGEEVLDRCRDWAALHGHRVVVVFDRAAPGGFLGHSVLDGAATVVGTGDETADEWLVREAAELDARGEDHWLVTSDRGLRAAAGAGASRLVGGGSFLRELQALPRR